MAHETLHKSKEQRDTMLEMTGSVAELEAESVTFVVCTHFGLNDEVRASRYIALWDGDAKALRASLDRIANTARNLIDDIGAASVKSGKAVA